MDADGHVRKRVGEHQSALQDVLRRDAMGDVEDVRVRSDPLDHAVADSDELVD
jgi:hypothetical protein